MTDIAMPRLSDQMEEGTIVKWLADDGQHVSLGDELVEIETDKAAMAHPSEAEGHLEILVAEGETVAVGTLIARIGAARARQAGPTAPAGPAGPADDARPDNAFLTSSGSATDSAETHPTGAAGAPTATPVARRMAVVHGVALESLRGSGPRGRITRGDVLRAAGLPPSPLGKSAEVRDGAAAIPTVATPLASDNPTPDSGAEHITIHEPTRLQQVVARRMVESNATVPHFQVQTDIVMDEAISLRSRLQTLAGEGEPVPSYNDLVVRACAVMLRNHPLANGSFVADRFKLHERVNVGVAVAADDALVVPTIFDADTKSLGQIARESRRLAASVRDGTIRPAELAGGTFTVSNLGMYGMTAITPVVNPPQAAILGVGAMRDVLARVDGEIVDRTLLTLTLSCDHRILYGAGAALFLADIRCLLEAPLKLAL